MEGCSEPSTSEKPAGSRSKTSGLSASTRQQRNQAEKQRRDRLNGYISELASIVPMVSNASKPLDKVSILRLAAAQMRLNLCCLNPKRYKCKIVTLPPSVISYLDLIEKTVGGFVIATTFAGCIVFCSKSIEDYIGYQNIDVMGNSVFNYIHSGDLAYFEKKVNSVINSNKKSSKKKTKVIKAHMQQRPLPRSNDIRYRKMIFKISVHLNDPNGNGTNGLTHTNGKGKKTGRLKDFGSSAIVLLFVEPVRLEPEIDVSYIESHQDAYFTMHGLQGEIIYADQRISSITGYMPHDVQGISAYKYICSSDVPIALFAQKAMFTSNDGTGVIVYRLKIRDMRYIYLKSSGQIAFKDSTNEISHFVCFNKLLSDEEGSQELKKFQQRFAPQMETEMRQNKKNVENQSQPPNMAVDTLNDIDSLIIEPQASASKSCLSVKDLSNESPSGICEQNLSSDDFMSPANSAVNSGSVHSSDRHSLISPVNTGGPSSVASEYSKLSFNGPNSVTTEYRKMSLDGSNAATSEHNKLPFDEPNIVAPGYKTLSYDSSSSGASEYNKLSFDEPNAVAFEYNKLSFNTGNNLTDDQLQFLLDQQQQQQTNQVSLLNSFSFSDNSMQLETTIPRVSPNSHEQGMNGFDQTLMENCSRYVNDLTANSTFNNEQDNIFVIGNSDDKMQSVDSFIAVGNDNTESDEVFMGHTVDAVLECAIYQNNSPLLLNNMTSASYAEPIKSAGRVSSQNNTYESLNGHTSYINTSETGFIDPYNSLKLVGSNPLSKQQMNFQLENTHHKGLPYLNDSANFSGLCEASPNSSLSENQTSLSGTDMSSTLNYSPGISSNYSDNGSCSSGYMSGSGHNYEGGVNGDEYNSMDMLNSQILNTINPFNFTIPSTAANVFTNFAASDSCDLLNLPTIHQASAKSIPKNLELNENPQYSRLQQVPKPTFSTHQNGSCGPSTNGFMSRVGFVESNGTQDSVGNGESALNKELYRELDMFFQNLSPTETSSNASFIPHTAPECFADNSSYLQNNISSRAKKRYHQ